jgi:hypothetical protein
MCHLIAMQISVGEVFRVTSKGKGEGTQPSYRDFQELTRGRHATGVNTSHGIWPLRPTDEPTGDSERIPSAIICWSNPFSPDARKNPWIDIIEQDEGYALYNGDNKTEGVEPFTPLGNNAFWTASPLYSDPSARVLAPPVLLFRQAEVDGRRSGFREFCGFGIPTRLGLRTQRVPNERGYFVNLVVELALFDLSDSGGLLDWNWIDDRRDSALTPKQALKNAPPAWKRWVKGTEVDRLRRRVVRDRVITKTDQAAHDESDLTMLRDIRSYFNGREAEFEGLASRVAARVIGGKCERKWVTRASRDGGIDFVCLLPIGEPQSRTGVVVLGQAKCLAPEHSVGPEDLARLVARLRRGWIGAYVTTGTFTEQAQEEVLADNYPLLLISGGTVAREVRRILSNDGGNLEQLLDSEATWYRANLRPWHPARAMEELNFGVEVPFPRAPVDRPPPAL